MFTGSVEDLINEVTKVFQEKGYTKSSIRERKKTLTKLLHQHNEQGYQNFCREIVTGFIANEERRFNDGEVSRTRFNDLRCIAEYLIEYHDTGTIGFKRRKPIPNLSDYYEKLLSEISAHNAWGIKMRKNVHDLARPCFRWLETAGYDIITNADINVIRKYLVECSTRMTGNSLDSARRGIKKLYSFLAGKGIVADSYSNLLTFYVPIYKRIIPFTPQDEIAAMLFAIDRGTSIGKRDYAMLLLATVTGLRAIDISGMTMNSVDWRNGEIKIVQSKTGRPLALPLTTDVAEALLDYIINGRPFSVSKNIFLRTKAPFTGIGSGSLGSAFRKYRQKSGLASNSSFHGLRRSIATNMVVSGVRITDVAQALGHRSINSTKQYISLNTQQLKECALGFAGITVGGAFHE